MKKPPSTFIVLLRGVNVGGNNLIPMAGLRSLCTDIGADCVQTYIQSGNLVLNASMTAAALEAKLAQGIQRRWDLSIPIIVRTATQWPAYIQNNPFPNAAKNEPNFVMLALAKSPLKSDTAEKLLERAANGERVHQNGDALWIHFVEGAGKSKLPALFDRFAGSPVTLRNWNTILKLDEMAREAAE